MEPVTLQAGELSFFLIQPLKVSESRFLCEPLNKHDFSSSSSPLSDGCTDGTMASSSNDSHYSGSRVETPVSYMGDDDEEDEYDENDDED